jgi:hypothetical protein
MNTLYFKFLTRFVKADMTHGNEKASNNTKILGGFRGGTSARLKKKSWQSCTRLDQGSNAQVWICGSLPSELKGSSVVK